MPPNSLLSALSTHFYFMPDGRNWTARILSYQHLAGFKTRKEFENYLHYFCLLSLLIVKLIFFLSNTGSLSFRIWRRPFMSGVNIYVHWPLLIWVESKAIMLKTFSSHSDSARCLSSAPRRHLLYQRLFHLCSFDFVNMSLSLYCFSFLILFPFIVLPFFHSCFTGLCLVLFKSCFLRCLFV